MASCQPAVMRPCPLAPPGLILQTFGATLLLAISLSAQNARWDRPTCTEGVVSVSRGGQAVLACNSSNPFVYVTIRLRAHGQNQIIFNKKSPETFSWGGWQLEVRGGQAQLVIQHAQAAHAGLYQWHLQGLQRHNKETRLNVSERQDQEAELGPELSSPPWSVPPLLPGSKKLQTVPEANLGYKVGIPVAAVFLILMVAGFLS